MREEFIHIPGFDSHLPFSVVLAGVSYCDGTYRIHRQRSNVHVLEYVLSGYGTVSVRDRVQRASAGDVYFLHEGEEHTYASSAEAPWIKLWLNVKGPLVDALIDSYALRAQTVFSCPAEPYFRRMHACLSEKDIPSDEMMHRVSLIFHELMQQLSACKEDGETVPYEALRMKNYIDAHVYEVLTTGALASYICKSEAQAIRLFKKAYGVTPYEYYLNLRMKKAVSLLESTGLSVKEIAYRLHFCDEHYFSGLVRRKTGRTPCEIRRKASCKSDNSNRKR